MRTARYLIAAFGLVGATMSASADAVVVSGGAIVTDANGGTAEALVAVDGRITFVGKAADAKAQAKGARTIDLKGGFAYPGFTDSHAHLLGIGLREVTLDLAHVRSLKELQAALGAYAKANPSGPITGRGWIETHWPEKRFPTRFDIDAIVADRPVLLDRADGHAAVANSAALKLGGIVRTTPNPAGGRIERDAKGEATGMLIDAAMSLVEDEMPEPSPEFRRAALKRGMARVASMGWTGIHNMSVSADELAMQIELAAAGALPIRIDNYLDADAGAQVLKSGPYQDSSGRVRVRGVKLYVDGALGSRGAALLAPYSDAKSSGLILLQQKDMLSYLARAKASGAQIAVHAIGDRGNRLVLDAFSKTFGAKGGRDLRWRVEHAQVVAPQDLPRFAKLGVVASMQPSHAISDLYFAPARLGTARLKGAYAWKSLLTSGATIAGGSDAPVEKGEALEEFYAAIYRHDRKGNAGDDWHLEEAVGRSDALAMFTLAPAYTVFHEGEVGTLAVGKRADLSVFSVDLLKASPAQIIAGRPVMTIVDGAVVFSVRDSE
jgi:predicted amidohydrolase YtcJ